MERIRSSTFEFRHEYLGRISGLAREEDIVNFRGIPYATIPARFRQSKVLEKLPTEPFEALLPGPICPQAPLPFPQYWDDDDSETIPKFPPLSQDEYKCLNLSIVVPHQALDYTQDEHPLPVLVYIHGGAFVGGSQTVRVGGREIYDGTNFVRSSIKLGQPILVVTINYRLGPLSFLASSELAAFNKSHGEAVGNYGLHDQRQALIWVNKFIGGFGGDPENVTIYGTSAGAASCHYHSISPDRKFRRAVLSSATLFGIGPMPVQHHQRLFEQFKTALVPDDQDPVKCLQGIPVQQLVNAVPLSSYNPLLGRWIREDRLHGIDDDLSPPDLMIGACEYERELIEGSFATPPIQPVLANWINSILTAGLLRHHSSIPSAVLNAYGIPIPDRTPKRPLTQDEISAWTDLIADTIFRIPAIYTTRTSKSTSKSKIHLFECKATNPYPPPRGESSAWYGNANHGILDLFAFNPAEDKVPAEHADAYIGAVSEVQRCVVQFAWGGVPWPACGKERKAEQEVVHVFESGGGGSLARGLREAVGEEVARRWEVVLRCGDGTGR